MNLKPYFTPQFLFEINTVMLEKLDKGFFALGILFLALAVLFKIAAILAPTDTDKKYRGKFYTLFVSMGLAEIIWFGARYEQVRFFGSHFVAFLILLIGLVWLVNITISAIKNYGWQKRQWEKEQVKLKYLPK